MAAFLLGSQVERERNLSPLLLVNPVMRGPTSWPHPTGPPKDPISKYHLTEGLGFKLWIWGRHKHSVHNTIPPSNRFCFRSWFEGYLSWECSLKCPRLCSLTLSHIYHGTKHTVLQRLVYLYVFSSQAEPLEDRICVLCMDGSLLPNIIPCIYKVFKCLLPNCISQGNASCLNNNKI